MHKYLILPINNAGILRRLILPAVHTDFPFHNWKILLSLKRTDYLIGIDVIKISVKKIPVLG